jgi:hypothetical protein
VLVIGGDVFFQFQELAELSLRYAVPTPIGHWISMSQSLPMCRRFSG